MLIGLELIESSKEGQLLANCKAINLTCRIIVMIMDGYGQDDKNEVITPPLSLRWGEGRTGYFVY